MIKLILFSLLLTSCAMTKTNVTNDLRPGMTVDEFQEVMGEPDTTLMERGAVVYKYSLHKDWHGFIPYYFYFHKGKLVSWRQDMAESRANKKEWGNFANSLNKQQRESERLRLESQRINNQTNIIDRNPEQYNCVTYGNQTRCTKQ